MAALVLLLFLFSLQLALNKRASYSWWMSTPRPQFSPPTSSAADEAAEIGEHPAILGARSKTSPAPPRPAPQFLGLSNRRGLCSDSDFGSDAIIGVLDTGIWPEHRSFTEHNMGPIAARWKGECETGPSFTTAHRNRKLIGACFFARGYEATTGGSMNDTAEFQSPRDADGHGSYTASTAAGRYVFQANMSGYASGIARGVAPKAASTQTYLLPSIEHCRRRWMSFSVSIGGGWVPYYLDCIALGSFAATAKGFFVGSSDWNDGPTGLSVMNLAPLGDHRRSRQHLPADVTLSNGKTRPGVSLYSGTSLAWKMCPGKAGGLSTALCMDNSLSPGAVKGKIVAKGLVVKNAGGVGMVRASSRLVSSRR
ncbi:hypothetical protein AMTR_s00066p00160520 [Amborella trichopoda]|uniref:Peptidase S8/S53 domain-containing protein n=1 Tax=Amborella trichopoda TaxID=13333 RepID=U5DI51_AMBTC|nr:hypothetical protein AMTR_s00066p00160520 [Amborella trichopoda]